ncbi:MAG TPA: hypothetical protein VIW24_07990 [Aldersonia sp.]
MATFTSVTRENILQAIAEYDSRGADDFLGVYGYVPSDGYDLVHEGRSYDPKAILGVAHRYATGFLVPSGEFSSGDKGAAVILRKRGFEVTEPVVAPRVVPAPAGSPRAASPRARADGTATKRKPAAKKPTRRAVAEPVVKLCPTCSMVLPNTGICDYCS